MIEFVNPRTGNRITNLDGSIYDSKTEELVGVVIDDIPRFIKSHQNYADSFGYQWNKWNTILSDSRNSSTNDAKLKTILKRTKFDKFDTRNKSLLECGCGGGDDTEILLKFNFSEIHSFDLSTSVERAKKYISNTNVVFSQSSIYDIPYRDNEFDFVFCHRVLQHTPDPELALKSVIKKVKPGGILFIHSYHRTFEYMMHFKYKYRFITKRLPHKLIESFLDKYASSMHKIHERLYGNKWGRKFCFNFVPLEFTKSFANFSREEIIELEKLVTFDALTPKYDKPITWKKLKKIVEGEGFTIEYFNDNAAGSPIYLTAKKNIQ